MAKALVVLVLMACCHAACFGGGAVMVDPRFAYYHDRSAESIVEEIKANEYDEVHLCASVESALDPALVKGFRDAGIKVWLVSSLNGTTTTAGLPEGWEAWRMVLRLPQGDPRRMQADQPASGSSAVQAAMPGNTFTYLCPNNPAYREWKKKQIVEALTANQFTGIDLTECAFPAYAGPESRDYGCLCDACAAAFFRWGSTETAGLPGFEDKDTAHFWKTDTALYEKWVGFRVSTVVDWLDEIVNGKGGIREKFPNVKVATWCPGLDAPEPLAKLREWQGVDAAAIVRRVKPDSHVIRTAQPDWSKPELPSDYPGRYKPLFDAIHEAAPSLPIVLESDIGSAEGCRRTAQWITDAQDAAKKAGFGLLLCYEYQLGDSSYTVAPELVKWTFEQDTITLVFSKRLDAAAASNISSYSLSPGRVDFARVDGNIVRLTVSGASSGSVLTVSGLTDDAQRRLFRNRPACPVAEGLQLTLD